MNIRLLLTATMLGSLCATPLATNAMGNDSPAPAVASNTDYSTGRAAIDRKDWDAAITSFQKVVARDKKNADAYNWLGYANRQAGKLDEAFKNYDTALAINPKHRGAHEYVGEAYLMVKNLDKAEEQLATLAKLCNSNCEEYRDLQQAITGYKAQH
jgi:Flp pilus assembly protein TadD